MSDPIPSQRAFSPAHATCAAPTDAYVAAVAVGHAIACGVAFLLAESLNASSPPLAVLALLGAFHGGAIVLYWQLGLWLVERRGYRGADPYLRLCAGLTLADLAVRAWVVLTAGRFYIASIPVIGAYGLALSYPHLQFFAYGTSLIALSFSLLRMPRPGSTLRGYALAVLAMGMAYSAFAARTGYLPAIAADLFLVRLFWPATAVAAAQTSRVKGHAAAFPATR